MIDKIAKTVDDALLAGSAPAAGKVLELTGLLLAQLEVIELNQALAVQGLAVPRDLGLADDDPRVNPNGRAIALGHPLGASGAGWRPLRSPAARKQRSLRAVHDVHRRWPRHCRDPGTGVGPALSIFGQV